MFLEQCKSVRIIAPFPLQAESTMSSLRLVVQDVALSRRKQGFESPRERHKKKSPEALFFMAHG